jgi:DNA repair protein RadC
VGTIGALLLRGAPLGALVPEPQASLGIHPGSGSGGLRLRAGQLKPKRHAWEGARRLPVLPVLMRLFNNLTGPADCSTKRLNRCEQILCVGFEKRGFSMSQLYVNDETGAYRPAQDAQILQEARAAAQRVLVQGFDMSSSKAFEAVLPALLAPLQNEVFCVAFMNPALKLIEFSEMFQGNPVMTPVFVRQIIKKALDLNASAMILVHNHPVGDPDPSDADIRTTMAVGAAAKLFEIQMLDHYVVGGGKMVSIRGTGKLNGPAMLRGILEDISEKIGEPIPEDLLKMLSDGEKKGGKKVHYDARRFS